MTYPSTRQVSSCYDATGQVKDLLDGSVSSQDKYAESVSYAPHGALQQMTLGNGVAESWSWDDERLQPASISATKSGGTLLAIGLDFGTAANNNGNVRGRTIYDGTSTSSQSFAYDRANRLEQTAEASGWTQRYVYDAYGNRAMLSTSYMAYPTLTPQVSAPAASAVAAAFPNNRWTGATHDAAGNQTLMAGRSFTYDAENRIATSTIPNMGASTYTYDGEGRRVKKVMGTATTVFVYDAAGRLAAEYSTQTNPESGRRYLTADHPGQ